MGRLTKRGMSPLIATVLLMAFAVALGGMIMNYTSDIGDAAAVDCSQLKLSVSNFCYDGEAIKLRARNTGGEAISQLILHIDHPETGDLEVTIKESRLNKGQEITRTIPIGVSDETEVSVIAGVETHGEAMMCPEPSAKKKPLPTC